LPKNPTEIFAMLDSLEAKSIAAAGQAGSSAAKSMVDYFSGKDEEPPEDKSIKNALLNTKPEETAGVISFITSKATRLRKVVFQAPWQKIGYNIGSAVGTILINVLLLAATEGIGNLIAEVSAGLGKISPLLSGVGKTLVGIGTRIAEVEKAIATLLGTLLKPLSKATKWIEPLLKPLEELMAKLGGFVRKLLGLPEKAAIKAFAQGTAHLAEEAAGKLGSKGLSTESKAGGSLLHDAKHPPKGIKPAEAPHSPSTETGSVHKPQAATQIPQEPPITKTPTDAVKVVEENPNLIQGKPGRRRASVGEGHEIVEVRDPSLPSGIGCELHSPPPYPKIPCPEGMGRAKREPFAGDKELEDMKKSPDSPNNFVSEGDRAPYRGSGKKQMARDFAHDVGVAEGAKAAQKDKLSWFFDNPRGPNRTTPGFDAIYKDPSGNFVIVEFKGGEATLKPGQMTNDWVNREIAKLEKEFPNYPVAKELRNALKRGQLSGVTYSTKIDTTGKLLETTKELHGVYSPL
jgi:hypothetical protein